MMNLTLWHLGLRWLRLKPLTFVGVIGLAAGQLVSILFIAQVFQGVLALNAQIDQITGRATIMVALGLASSTGLFLSRIMGARIASNAARHLRVELLDMLYTRSYAYYARSNSGALHATLVLDSERAQKFFEAALGQVLPAIIVGIGIGAALIALNTSLVLVLLVIAPLLLVFNHYSLQPLRRQIDRHMKTFKAYSLGTLAILQLITLTRMQTAEIQETARQTVQIDALKRETEALSRHQAFQQAVQNAILLTVVGVLLVIGGSQVATGQTTLGSLLAFNVILLALRRYVQDALGAAPALVDGYHALETLQQLIAHAQPEPYSGTHRYSMHGAVTLSGVTFGYADQAPTLCSVNLTLAPHTVTALVGPNGSGKTTLVNLLLGLYRPQQGCLYADGHPYNELDIRYLRRQIGVLPQDPLLFDGTAWENITYGMSDVSREQVVAAAEMASAHVVIQQLPQGYETLIGERGVRLSGGQRQRIALARVLLRQPKLLILDEPTNHLDETAAQQLIENLMQRDSPPTTLIISHDMALARQADQLYILSGGRLMASHSPAAFAEPWMRNE